MVSFHTPLVVSLYLPLMVSLSNHASFDKLRTSGRIRMTGAQ